MKKISIIDYGMGNVESLKNAILKIGHEPELYSNKSKISSNISKTYTIDSVIHINFNINYQ